ncbi:MAG: hypothetical protein J6K81_00180 [Rikenellaceae bacterium]|nr:hypothetical protein [Rikenellaceae bacterium]
MKKLLLIVLAIVTFMACSDKRIIDNIAHGQGIYLNGVDKTLDLTLYGKTTVQYVKEYTIAANDKLIMMSNFGYSDPFITLDSIHGVWGNERDFWIKGEDAKIFKHNWANNRHSISESFFQYSFTFTREMYDAATPIEK